MKTFSEHSDLEEYKKTADITQRRKQARRMRLLSKQSGFKMKKKRTLMKVRDVGKITKSAKKQTIKMFRNKLYPNYNDMSIPHKVKADQLVIKKYGAKIDKVAKKVAMKLKSKESERVANLKASETEK